MIVIEIKHEKETIGIVFWKRQEKFGLRHKLSKIAILKIIIINNLSQQSEVFKINTQMSIMFLYVATANLKI